jgi:hypothetical protein
MARIIVSRQIAFSQVSECRGSATMSRPAGPVSRLPGLKQRYSREGT